MSRSWQRIVPVKDSIGPATNPAHIPGEFIVFSTDGSLVNAGKNYGSWKVVGYKPDGNEWKRIFDASASEVPAKCSGQMELRGIISALKAALEQYPTANILIRTDHSGHFEVINRYLNTYKHAYRGDDIEENDVRKRMLMRRDQVNSHMKDEYTQLFDILDAIGVSGRHNERPFEVVHKKRMSDAWMCEVDSGARKINLAYAV